MSWERLEGHGLISERGKGGGAGETETKESVTAQTGLLNEHMDKDIAPGCGVGALHTRLWLPEDAFRGLACKSKGHTPHYAPRSPSTTLQDFSELTVQKKLNFLSSKLRAYLTDEPHSSPDQLTLIKLQIH